MSNATNILNDLEQAIALTKAQIVLAENLDKAMGVQQKRRAIDLLMSFRSQLEQAALFIGREIYPVEHVERTIQVSKKENRAKYHAGDVIIDGKKIARGLHDEQKSLHDENRF